MADNDIYGVAKYMANDLEKAAASEDTQPIKEALIQQGAIGSVMTGSGAAVFGVFDSEEKAKAACEYFRGKVRSVFIAKPVNFGATVARNKPPRRK
jgi:4-diphosphocytidyl-2-C-methyl-D-erythritol kinase